MAFATLIKRRGSWFAALAVAVALAGVYGIASFARNPASPGMCTDAQAAARRIAPLARGEVAALTVASNPQPVPELTFTDDQGQPKKLADWRGRVVLFNLWATWCVPCRKEMPALDALQAKLAGTDFDVVAVNIDTRDPEKPKAWLRTAGVSRLGYYADASAGVFQTLKTAGKAFGMPTTLLVDAKGCELASLAGPAEWASDDAVALIKAAVSPKS